MLSYLGGRFNFIFSDDLFAMLLSREFVIQSLQRLLPTHESLAVLSMYLLSFPACMPEIMEIIALEYRKSSAHHRLAILYLLNEIMNQAEGREQRAALLQASAGYYKDSVRAILGHMAALGRETRLSKSMVPLLKKHLELKRVWTSKAMSEADMQMEEDQQVSRIVGVEEDIDYDHIVRLAKKRDRKGIVKYVQGLQG